MQPFYSLKNGSFDRSPLTERTYSAGEEVSGNCSLAFLGGKFFVAVSGGLAHVA